MRDAGCVNEIESSVVKAEHYPLNVADEYRVKEDARFVTGSELVIDEATQPLEEIRVIIFNSYL